MNKQIPSKGSDTDFIPVSVKWNGQPQFLFPQHPLVVAAYDGKRIAGEDEKGAFVVIPLANRIQSPLYGHVFLVSPEDEALALKYRWLALKPHAQNIHLVRTEMIVGKQHHTLFTTELKQSWYNPEPKKQHHYGHPLDFRRSQIKPCKKPKNGFYGLFKYRKRWQYAAYFEQRLEHLGYVKTAEEGARLYNDALRDKRWEERKNLRHPIHDFPYNDVTPRFTDGNDETPPEHRQQPAS